MVWNLRNIGIWFSKITTLYLVAIFSSCTYDKGVDDLQPSNQCDTAAYTYTTDIDLIIQTNCAFSGCHDGQTGIGGVKLTNYQEVKNKVDDGRLKMRMIMGPSFMPPTGKLPDTTLAKVQQWLDEGACL